MYKHKRARKEILSTNRPFAAGWLCAASETSDDASCHPLGVPPMMLPRNRRPSCSVAALAVATRAPVGSSSSCRIRPSGDTCHTHQQAAAHASNITARDNQAPAQQQAARTQQHSSKQRTSTSTASGSVQAPTQV
eukprot:GHRQ01025936.1.p2 GENE.GHRQ01025936.1~~GHRQ01025936.1.p2  ORF type:complete len:135 (+),score=28.35 GHRQ01025936.1:440-844(+)